MSHKFIKHGSSREGWSSGRDEGIVISSIHFFLGAKNPSMVKASKEIFMWRLPQFFGIIYETYEEK